MTDNNVKIEFEALRTDFAQMRGDLSNLAKAIGELTTQGAMSGLADLKHSSKSVQKEIHTALDRADALRQSGVAAIEQQISERPLAVIALAFGIGLLIGKTAHRR